jgi:hypothetical protein
VDISRSPYAENITVDAKGIVHKRHGYKPTESHVQTPSGIAENVPFDKVYGMYVFKPTKKPEVLIVHSGAELYSREVGGTTFWHITGWDNNKWGYMNAAPSCGFQHKDRFYILDGQHYYVYWFSDDDGQWCLEPVYMGATPTETQIAGFYTAEETKDDNDQPVIKYAWQFGEKGERNILTQRRIDTFCGDGVNATFYLDGQNLKVLKVEQYSPSTAAPSTGGEGTFTTGNGSSNVRTRPSMDGGVLGIAPAHTTYPVLGKEGNWYKIQFLPTTVGYIHSSRGTYTAPSGGQTVTASTDWVTLTEGTDYDVAEVGSSGETAGSTGCGVTVANCTKIVFKAGHIPSAHPRGAGLPNIRVTCVPVESATFTFKGSDLNSNNQIQVTAPRLATSGTIIVKKGDTTVANTSYTVTTGNYHDHLIIYVTFSSGVIGANEEATIYFTRESMDGIDAVCSCDKYGKYGEYNFDRFFFTGNTTYLNRDWYSEPSDATCVLENSYNDIGDPATPIAGYLNMQSDMLVVKERTPFEALFRRTASSDGDIPIFPVKSYQGDGAINRYCLCNIKGKCLYLTDKGLREFVSSDLGSKYGVQERSLLVNEKMLAETDYDQATITAYNDLVIVSFPSGHCYVADTNQQTAPSTDSSYGFEWFYWTNVKIERFVEFDGVYYFTFTETVSEEEKSYLLEIQFDDYADYVPPSIGSPVKVPIRTIWTTPQDMMEEPAMIKHMERRGAVMTFLPFEQRLSIGIAIDGHSTSFRREGDVTLQFDGTDYDMEDFHASGEEPYVALNRTIPRFRYIQFLFLNDDPDTDGIALINFEFQYRFGRYVHYQQ